jgi:hypothetical protein
VYWRNSYLSYLARRSSPSDLHATSIQTPHAGANSPEEACSHERFARVNPGKMGLELNREGEYSLLGPGEDIAEFSGGAEMSEREMPGDILRDHMARVAGNNRI